MLYKVFKVIIYMSELCGTVRRYVATFASVLNELPYFPNFDESISYSDTQLYGHKI